MKQLSPYIAWALRITSGMLLVLIGVQSIEPTTAHHSSTIFPIVLATTNVLLLDVLLRVLFVGFGIAIMLGIRTRLLSAFMFAVTLLTASICIQACINLNSGHVLLGYLIGGLATLIVRGGGIHALLPEGWRNIPL